jgi:topoisomerase IV subunit A
MVEEKDKNLSPENEKVSDLQEAEEKNQEGNVDIENEEEQGNEKIASTGSSNTHLRRLISSNYLEYSSYVIKERAIPELKDGLKPVQRRILWSLFRMDDGKFHKVANIVGHTMQYHPHGDASIYGALVNLANKEYFIDKQGNFGNIFTGDDAAAARYIEARLTPLGREVMFNPDITDFIDSYDGRNKEPVFLPAKVPALLMVGQEGIAPGMTTSILPHNFKELLEAQISVLKKEDFIVYPDFLQGGIMDVSEYNDGEGKINLRAKIDIEGRKLLIKEIPAYTTTEKLIASIEKAVNKNKIKLASVSDYTAESVEIELIPARGYNPEKALKALYTYTDCSMSVTSSILLIKENRPVMMTVSEIIRSCTEYLVEYLRTELQLELDRLNERFHERTLERIFIENRIYKRIEDCETYELVKQEVFKGLKPFINLLKREINDKDIEKLLAIPIRRISKFDINKNKEETDKILAAIKEVENNLKHIIKYTISYIEKLIKNYASKFIRRTVIQEFEEIDKKAAALNNIKVGWDRKSCYIGESVKSEDIVTCNEYNHLICIDKSGTYKVIAIPQKMYVGRLYYFNKYSKNNIYSIIYKEKKTGAYFVKRCQVNKFIRDKEYRLIPKGCQLEQLTIRENSIYECKLEKTPRQKIDKIDVNFSKVQMRNPGARGFKVTDRKIKKITFTGFAEYIEPEIVVEENIESPDIEVIDTSTNKAAESLETGKITEDIEKESEKDTSLENVEKEIFVEDLSDESVEKEIEEVETKNHSEKSDTLKEGAVEKSESKEKPETKKQIAKKNDKKPVSRPIVKEELTDKNTIANSDTKAAGVVLEKAAVVVKNIQKDDKQKTEKDLDNPDENEGGDDEDWGIVQPDLGF